MATLVRVTKARSGVVLTETAARAPPQHAPELGEAPRRVGEEHQGHAADDRVEAPVGHGEGLSVLDGQGGIGQPAQALARAVEHRARDVGGDRVAGESDRLGGELGGDAGAGGDVEHALAGGEPGGRQETRDELPRDVAEDPIVPPGARVVEPLERHDGPSTRFPGAPPSGPAPDLNLAHAMEAPASGRDRTRSVAAEDSGSPVPSVRF